jgi:molybdate transport system substrate-binding protein
MKVISALAVKEVLQRAVADFSRDSGHPIDVQFGTMGALQARLAAGETADVAILAVPLVEALQKDGLLTGRTDLARTDIGVAIRDGASLPDLSTPEAFVRMLRDARAVAFTDPAAGGTAGVYLAGLLQRLGIADAIKAKTVWQPNGFQVAQCVAQGGAEIGVTLISEIVPVKGTSVAGALPPALQNSVSYAAALFAHSAARDEAQVFIKFLASPALSGRWKACGFEIASEPQGDFP